MKIRRIAFGNEAESFVENRILDDVNIIFSDDNNRGKTLVMQGLMYSMGYESIFPSSFNYRDQYFYSEIERNGETYEFLRKNNSFVVRATNSIQIFSSAREFRYFYDSNFFTLPRIIKDGKPKMVDFSLFHELYFIGQDNRSPSSLISKGQFNKTDFKSMIFSIAGFSDGMDSEKEINELKERVKDLKIKLKSVKKTIGIIRANPNIAEIASKTYDSEVTQEKIKICRSIYENISEIKRARQREINRISKLEALITELNSLNRGLNEGNVKCGECGSEKIVYSNNDLTFEVSNTKVRLSILESIRNNILQKHEIVEEYTNELNVEQDRMAKEMASSPPNFQEVFVYQETILSERDCDNEASNISNEIKALELELDMKKSVQNDNKGEKKKLLDEILEEMSKIYKTIDPNGNLFFNDLFTKKDATFSGSEEQEYYFSRLIALNNILKHDFPIIVDSFRDGEVSTPKERKMLNIYKLLGKQVILTSTLKNEEYETQKYTSEDGINALDYSSHQDCKIMQRRNKNEFMEIINSYEGIII